MIIMDVKLNHVYGFDDFHINFSYPRKLAVSLLGDETLEGRERFRFKKAVILMGTNATGKTSLGRALLKIFSSIREANEAILRELDNSGTPAMFQVDFVNEGYTLHRFAGNVDGENISIRYYTAEIGEMDSYEMAVGKLTDRTEEIGGSFKRLKAAIGPLEFRFAYPEIETSLRVSDIDKKELLKTLRAVIGTLDPTLKDVAIAKDLKDSFIIRRRGKEIIIQEGKLLNRELLSSGTAEGIDVAVFLASMLSQKNCFYYCDEHFSYIQSNIERRIFGLMVEHLGKEINAIADIYASMILLDLDADKITLLKTSPFLESILKDDLTNMTKRINSLAHEISSEQWVDLNARFFNIYTLNDRLKESNTISQEFSNVNNNWMRARIIPVERKADASLKSVLLVFESIDEERKKQEHLQHLSETDKMTGILNRGTGEQKVREKMVEGQPGMFCLFDADKFKSVNDNFGHAIGDKVIMEIAKCLTKTFRDSDVYFRLGGDEFAAYVVEVTDPETGQRIFDRFFNCIDNIYIPELGRRRMHISAGAAFYRTGEDTFRKLGWVKLKHLQFLTKSQVDSSLYKALIDLINVENDKPKMVSKVTKKKR